MISNPTPDPEFAVPTATSADDLADRLEAILTERFTELGNPFSRMRIAFQGPDGWPASKEVGPHDVALVLRELLAAAPAVPSVSAVDQTTRDRIAEALREHYLCTNRDEADADGNMPCRCGDWREPGPMGSDEDDWDSHLADAVMPVLPPADRAAVLREAADFAAAFNSDCQNCAVELEVSAELRRMADEAQQPAVGARQPDTETRPSTPGSWVVQTICCGHDDGKPEFDSWEAADRFREIYVDSARIAGHERSAIVRRGGEPTTAASAVPGRSAATSTDEETRSAQDGAES